MEDVSTEKLIEKSRDKDNTNKDVIRNFGIIITIRNIAIEL